MPDKPAGLEKQIDVIMKALSLLAKVGLLIGGGCIVFYSLINGHYPQGVSIGDGLLFLIAALCFGVVYLVFTACITATGILLSPILIPTLKLIQRITNRFSKEKTDLAFSLQTITLPSVIFGFFGAAFIFALSRKDIFGHIQLLILPLFQYLIYSALLDQNKKIKLALTSQIDSTSTDGKENESGADLGWLRKVRFMMVALIVFTPLLMGGVGTDLLKTAMIAAKIRIEKATINVKPPYASLLPSETKSKLENYKRFENATVIFRGVGNTTLVEMSTDEMSTRLEIPNDSIILERNDKLTTKVAKKLNVQVSAP